MQVNVFHVVGQEGLQQRSSIEDPILFAWKPVEPPEDIALPLLVTYQQFKDISINSISLIILNACYTLKKICECM